MVGRPGPGRLTGPLIGALVVCLGCTGNGDSEDSIVDLEPTVAVPAELVAASWPVQMTEDALAPYTGQPGWISLVTRTDFRGAVEQLAGLGGLPAARAHTEAALMFRQAARLSAIAAAETYGESRQDTDPLGTAHLVALGLTLEGDLEGARAALDGANLAGVEPWDEPWTTFLGGDANWPPYLGSLPMDLPRPAVGAWPELLGTRPHYRLPERVEGEERTLDVFDPGALVAVALWHDKAAALAAPDSAKALETYRARYAFGVEPSVTAPVPLPMDLLFGSDLLVPGDGPFLADLLGDVGLPAVDAHAETSLIAALAVASRREDGTQDPEKAQDAAAEGRTAVLDAMVELAGGNTLGHHRVFADITGVGILRALSHVAELQGDHEGAGILLIDAMERSSAEWTADPKALLFLSAWDADNRYPVRGTELLHNLIRRYPSLASARFGLDALTLRESRSRGRQNPGQ